MSIWAPHAKLELPGGLGGQVTLALYAGSPFAESGWGDGIGGDRCRTGVRRCSGSQQMSVGNPERAGLI